MQTATTDQPAPASDNSPDKAPSRDADAVGAVGVANGPTSGGLRAAGHAGDAAVALRRRNRPGKPKEERGTFDGPSWQAESRFAAQRAEYYESWTAYTLAMELLTEFPGGRLPGGEGIEDYRAYLPNPDEIEQRKLELRWLQRLGFTDRFIASVMQKDSPPIAMVMEARRRGLTAVGIAVKFEAFLEPNEYDGQELLWEPQAS